MQSKIEMPLEHKPILTIREASFYTGISEKKLIEITNLYACPFVLWMGNHRFIKRKAFEKFIQTSDIVTYYYSDYRTVEELLQFIENIKKAFDMTWPITLANRYS